MTNVTSETDVTSVSFRSGCIKPPESRFLLSKEAADGGSADLKLACDYGQSVSHDETRSLTQLWDTDGTCDQSEVKRS